MAIYQTQLTPMSRPIEQGQARLNSSVATESQPKVKVESKPANTEVKLSIDAQKQAEQQQDVPGQEQLEAEEVHQVDRRGRPAEDRARQPRRRAVRAVEEREVVREEEVREAEHMEEVV